jgi:hypothetical protein
VLPPSEIEEFADWEGQSMMEPIGIVSMEGLFVSGEERGIKMMREI